MGKELIEAALGLWVGLFAWALLPPTILLPSYYLRILLVIQRASI